MAQLIMTKQNMNPRETQNNPMSHDNPSNEGEEVIVNNNELVDQPPNNGPPVGDDKMRMILQKMMSCLIMRAKIHAH